jgi:nitroreductase
MTYSSFYNLLKTRRSIRKFEKREVEQGKIELLLNAGLMSPASKSRNPWEFVVITDDEMMKKLSLSKSHGAQFLAECPLGLVIIADTQKSDVWIEDASIASIIIQLQAHDLGLGSCWVQLRERKTSTNESSEQYVRKLLNIPANYAVLCIIGAGYPAESKKPYEENNLSYNKIHYHQF